MSDLSRLLTIVEDAQKVKLQPVGWNNPFRAWQLKRAADAMLKEAGPELLKALGEEQEEDSKRKADRERAAETGALVDRQADKYGIIEGSVGLIDRKGAPPAVLRAMYQHCEPATAIIETMVKYVVAFMQRPDLRRGYAKKPGLKIRMTIASQKATDEDKVRMEELLRWILRGGSCEPPRNERPISYQRGLKAQAAQWVRDSFTIDGIAMRRWYSELNRNKLVCYAAEDAGRVWKVRKPIVDFRNGVAVEGKYKTVRTNTHGEEIEYAMTADSTVGSTIIGDYTERDMVYHIRNPYSDISNNGYGKSELHYCWEGINIWIKSRRYNSSRFEKDSLPRGVLSVMAQLNEQQFQAFRLQWQQLMSGEGKRWFNPILKGNPQTGTSIKWDPIDLSPRDMEYHQFMYSVALWMHAIFGMHPEETGWEGMSPFRPPLSEASPETKLESSQNKCLAPFLGWFIDFLNQELLWVLDPTERYTLEAVGLGQGDEAADIALRGEILQFGLGTPRQMLHEMDTPIPEKLENDPCMDMLGTWAQNKALMMQQEQMEMGQQAQQQQMQQGQEQHEQQMAIGKMQAVQGMAAQGQQEDGQEGAPPASGPPQGNPFQRAGNSAPPVALQKALLFPFEERPRLTKRSPQRPSGGVVIVGEIRRNNLKEAFRNGARRR